MQALRIDRRQRPGVGSALASSQYQEKADQRKQRPYRHQMFRTYRELCRVVLRAMTSDTFAHERRPTHLDAELVEAFGIEICRVASSHAGG